MSSPATRAHRRVNLAVKNKSLIAPDSCELCGSSIQYSRVAHHWNGYDNPLDIWWICYQCNAILRGPHFHSGIVTKEEAISYINERKSGSVRQENRTKRNAIRKSIKAGSLSPTGEIINVRTSPSSKTHLCNDGSHFALCGFKFSNIGIYYATTSPVTCEKCLSREGDQWYQIY